MCLTCLAASFFIVFSGLQGEKDGLVKGIPHCLRDIHNGLHLSDYLTRQGRTAWCLWDSGVSSSQQIF